MTCMLSDYWAQYVSGGVHPADERFINASNSLRWRWPIGKRRTQTWASDTSLHGLLHLNLFPQPFLGNISSASVYLLMANPGLSLEDYEDDFKNHDHAAASEANLRQEGIGFYPLLARSDGTGAAKYWRSRFKSLQKDLSLRLDVSLDSARELLVRELAVVEAGPYHSKKFPGGWCDRLPTSRAARSFVRQAVLPRAARGDAFVLVLRRASFWRIPLGQPGVIFRSSKKAQLSSFLGSEREAMAHFLAHRLRGDI